MSRAKERKSKEQGAKKVCDVGNQHGYLCPSCKKGTNLHIQAVIHTEVELYPDGTEDSGGDTEWEDDSQVRCSHCGWHGTVVDLRVVEVVD